MSKTSFFEKDAVEIIQSLDIDEKDKINTLLKVIGDHDQRIWKNNKFEMDFKTKYLFDIYAYENIKNYLSDEDCLEIFKNEEFFVRNFLDSSKLLKNNGLPFLKDLKKRAENSPTIREEITSESNLQKITLQWLLNYKSISVKPKDVFDTLKDFRDFKGSAEDLLIADIGEILPSLKECEYHIFYKISPHKFVVEGDDFVINAYLKAVKNLSKEGEPSYWAKIVNHRHSKQSDYTRVVNEQLVSDAMMSITQVKSTEKLSEIVALFRGIEGLQNEVWLQNLPIKIGDFNSSKMRIEDIFEIPEFNAFKENVLGNLISREDGGQKLEKILLFIYRGVGPTEIFRDLTLKEILLLGNELDKNPPNAPKNSLSEVSYGINLLRDLRKSVGMDDFSSSVEKPSPETLDLFHSKLPNSSRRNANTNEVPKKAKP